MKHVSPIAKPKILMKEKALFFLKFRKAILKYFIIIVRFVYSFIVERNFLPVVTVKQKIDLIPVFTSL